LYGTCDVYEVIVTYGLMLEEARDGGWRGGRGIRTSFDGEVFGMGVLLGWKLSWIRKNASVV